MMIRSGLYNLSTRSPSKVFSTTLGRPTAAVVSGSVPGRWFSMNPKRRDDAILQKPSSGASDESDSRKVGKKGNGGVSKVSSYRNDVAPRDRYHGPLFRPLFSGFDDFFDRDPFAPFFSHRGFPFSDSMPAFRDFPMERRVPFLRSSPGYEIKEDGGRYEISVAVPDELDASNLSVELENDGTVLHLSGKKTTEEDGRVVSELMFEKRFSIGVNVDPEQITANFDKGVLVLKAPKLELEAPPKHTIPITQEPHTASNEEVIQKNYSDAFDESDWAEMGKAAGYKK